MPVQRTETASDFMGPSRDFRQLKYRLPEEETRRRINGNAFRHGTANSRVLRCDSTRSNQTNDGANLVIRLLLCGGGTRRGSARTGAGGGGPSASIGPLLSCIFQPAELIKGGIGGEGVPYFLRGPSEVRLGRDQRIPSALINTQRFAVKKIPEEIVTNYSRFYASGIKTKAAEVGIKNIFRRTRNVNYIFPCDLLTQGCENMKHQFHIE